MNLEEIEQAVRQIDPSVEKDSREFKASVVLLASAQEGPNVDRLTLFTGFPNWLIAEFGRNLRRSGIWKGGKVYADWMDGKEGGVAFMLDVLVATGAIVRNNG